MVCNTDLALVTSPVHACAHAERCCTKLAAGQVAFLEPSLAHAAYTKRPGGAVPLPPNFQANLQRSSDTSAECVLVLRVAWREDVMLSVCDVAS